MKKGKFRLLAFIAMIALLVLSACNSDDGGKGARKRKRTTIT